MNFMTDQDFEKKLNLQNEITEDAILYKVTHIFLLHIIFYNAHIA